MLISVQTAKPGSDWGGGIHPAGAGFLLDLRVFVA
jgi:hypothetical protein